MRSVGFLRDLMKTHQVIVTLLVSVMCVVLVAAKKPKASVSINIDDAGLKGKPGGVSAAWMGYGMARASWIADHVLGKGADPTTYRRSFDEEVAGRETLAKIWTEMKQSEPAADTYLDQLENVQKAGYLAEYVWAYLRSPDWKAPSSGLRLDEFDKWKAVNLDGHKPETFADVIVVETKK